ncbi:MAG TPA: prepilin-type N-terminal cleavage/methylation domain-containing protein [Verrucomicrobiae bacterium]|nr:prepilin-type N-terminal cleavage/methylation domain-containing protein [Verrucomicrobiae bacterium]
MNLPIKENQPLTAKPGGCAGLIGGLSQSQRLRIAFSLTELLIVIAIIAILAALLLPVINRSQEEGRATACISNLRQIGVALQMYVDSNNNTLPAMRDAPMDTNALATNSFPTVNRVLGTDLGNTNVLRCPSDFQGIFQLTGSSYAWNSLLNGENANHLVVLGMNFNPQAIPVFFDKQKFHAARGPSRAVNYLYADGHIKNLLTIEGALPQ